MSTAPKTGSAAARAYSWVRERILDGTYPAGRLLSEGEISEALEISRTPVREAFLQLAVEEMLELYPKRGALVVPVTATELMEVMAARSLIEPWAARTLALRLDRETVIPVLRELIAGTQLALSERDDQRFQELDRAFHERIVIAAGNRLLAQFYSSLRDRQHRAVHLAFAVAERRGSEITGEHEAIVNALAIGDGELAGALLSEHLEHTTALLGLGPIQGLPR
jgi:DNA-binding GntR family transcriptional regulator